MKFSDYLFILYKWRRFLLINLLIITVAGTFYSFLMPETFKATSLVLMTRNNSNGLNSVANLISGGTGSIGASLLGLGDENQDMIYGILYSRNIMTKVINRFKLMDYYRIDDNNYDKTIKSFEADLLFQPDENGLIEISVINRSPKLASEISNYFVELADSMNIDLSIQQARNNREFIEKRYFKNLSDLKIAEDSLLKFQKKTGIFAVSEQLQISVQGAAELESELFQKKMAIEFVKENFGINSPQYQSAYKQQNQIEAKVLELKNSSSLKSPSNILFPFKNIPDLTMGYYKLFREVEIQSKIMEFILPLYEQALVDEQKYTPTLISIDSAVPPQLKYAPKKAFVILLFFFFGLIILVTFVYWAENFVALENPKNELENSQKNLFSHIAKFYKVKF